MSETKTSWLTPEEVMERAEMMPELLEELCAGKNEALEKYFSIRGQKCTVTSISITK